MAQAQTLAKYAVNTPARQAAVAAPAQECGEEFLLQHAKEQTADRYRMLVKRWAAVADPEADERGYKEDSGREFVVLAPTTGGYHLAGFLTTEHGATVGTALDAVTVPPAADDKRTAQQRRAGALCDLARLVLDQGLVGTGTSVRPHLNVVVDYDTLTRALAGGGRSAGGRSRRNASSHNKHNAGGRNASSRNKLSAGGHSTSGHNKLSTGGHSGCGIGSGYDAGSGRSAGEGLGSAADGVPGEPTGGYPGASFVRPEHGDDIEPGGTVGIGTGIESTPGRLAPVADVERFAVGEIVGAGPIPRPVLARLACDGEVARLVFGPDSQVINVGKAERTFNGPRRRAIIARDQTCRYPGCTAPPALGELHHLNWWARDDGDTDINAGILLCWYHHGLVHDLAITISRSPSGGWTFTTRHGDPIAATRGR